MKKAKPTAIYLLLPLKTAKLNKIITTMAKNNAKLKKYIEITAVTTQAIAEISIGLLKIFISLKLNNT